MNPLPASNHQTARIFMLVVAVVAIFTGSHFLRQCLSSPVSKQTSAQRIIALSPSAVEIIYQLGLDDRLVGVSRFCKYPDDAKSKPVVGGYLDLDFEAVLRLKPDCVILLVEQHALAERLNQLGINTISVDHASTSGIVNSITDIGKAFGKHDESNSITSSIEKRVQAITERGKQIAPKPRVLVCITRDTNSDHPDRVIAAGNAGVHQEYITMAGGINAYQGSVAYPALSREKLIQLNPDIIIELIQEKTWNTLGEEKLFNQWAAYGELKAIANQRVYFIHENKHMIPGPRFVDTLEIFARAINPDTP